MKPVQTLDDVVIRFAGDSGDGMQVAGSQFTNTTALAGNDFATFPDFPAEIRAPAGTLAGVSGYQIRFASTDMFTPGDAPEVLFAMNPAALKANIADLKKGGMVVVNTEKFIQREFDKAGITVNPLEDGSLVEWQVVQVDMTQLTKKAVEGLGLGTKEVDRTKNFFALGMAYWLYSRDLGPTEGWITSKFKPPFQEANLRALRAGHAYAETLEIFTSRYEVPKAKLDPGTYRNIMGNQALSMGLLSAPRRRRRRCSWAATRSPRPRTSSTSWRPTRPRASTPSRPRTRSRRSGRRSARRSAARWASPPHRARAWRSRPRPSASR